MAKKRTIKKAPFESDNFTREAAKDAVKAVKIIAIINVSKHAIWTDQGRLAMGAIGKCGIETAKLLIDRGDADQVIEGPPDVEPIDD